MAHACNPSTLGDRGGQGHEVRSSRQARPTWQNPVSTKKIQTLARRGDVRQAEAGESLEPRRRKLQ